MAHRAASAPARGPPCWRNEQSSPAWRVRPIGLPMGVPQGGPPAGEAGWSTQICTPTRLRPQRRMWRRGRVVQRESSGGFADGGRFPRSDVANTSFGRSTWSGWCGRTSGGSSAPLSAQRSTQLRDLSLRFLLELRRERPSHLGHQTPPSLEYRGIAVSIKSRPLQPGHCSRPLEPRCGMSASNPREARGYPAAGSRGEHTDST